MSSKKQIRRQRRTDRKEERERKGKNPAVLFALAIGAAILLTLGAFALFGGEGGPGEPPWPGAVWSSAHGHWH